LRKHVVWNAIDGVVGGRCPLLTLSAQRHVLTAQRQSTQLLLLLLHRPPLLPESGSVGVARHPPAPAAARPPVAPLISSDVATAYHCHTGCDVTSVEGLMTMPVGCAHVAVDKTHRRVVNTPALRADL